MSDSFDIQSFSQNPIYSFNCDDKLLLTGGIDEDTNSELISSFGLTNKSITFCEDFNSSNPNLNELVDILSNSNSPNSKNLMELSLDDIPLTESSNGSSVFQLLPENIPSDNFVLFKVPEYMHDDRMLSDIMDVELDQTLLKSIDGAIQGHDGIFLTKPVQNQENQESVSMIRRPPLQLIQQVIKYPAVKNVRSNKNSGDKKASKRKQQFINCAREDVIIFYSDDDEEGSNKKIQPKLPVNLDMDCPPSPKIPKFMDDLVDITDINKPKKEPLNGFVELADISKSNEESVAIKFQVLEKSQQCAEKCPRCDKTFKKLVMHKCKGPFNENSGKTKRLKPSEILMPLKCTVCRQFFGNQRALDNHLKDKHSHLVCKVCKHISKNGNLNRIHSVKCGINIQPVKKTSLRSSLKIK